MELPVGEIGQPVRSGTGYHVFVVMAREEARTPPLEEVHDQVRSEWVRRAGDRALRDYLDGLREQASIEVRAELP
jgi:parvulin-like peptidyl-prolyl isomerase